jgi:succinoglycan biosynthesis transport protein ExoP
VYFYDGAGVCDHEKDVYTATLHIMPELSEPAGNLREYGLILMRRGWIIALTAILAGGVAYQVAKGGTPVYQAQAEVLVRGQPLALATDALGNATLVSIGTELRVVQGDAVRQAVRNVMPNAAPIQAAEVTGSQSFTITASATDAKLAADSANAYMSAYIARRHDTAVNVVVVASQQIQAKIDDLQKQITALGPVVPPPPTINGQAQPLPDVDVQRSALVNEQTAYRIQLNQSQAQLANVTPGAEVLSLANVPSTAVSPRPKRSAAEAAGGGLVLGLGLVFLIEYLDDSIKSSQTLEHITGNLPVLGTVPTVTRWRDRPELVSMLEPGSSASEAFRYLRTAVLFLGVDRSVGVIQVTSPSSQEGKTTIVANLGVVLAEAGERVLIVDCDMRRPRIHTFFGLSNEIGLTSVLLEEATLLNALQLVPGTPGLAVLTTGRLPPNPSELLSSSRATEIFATLRASGWLLVVDSPPLLPVSDACVVSSMADATILVASAGVTTKKQVQRAVDLLVQVKAPLVGTVLNRSQAGPRYSYEYGTYVGPAGQGPQRRQALDPGPVGPTSNGHAAKGSTPTAVVTETGNGSTATGVPAQAVEGSPAPTRAARAVKRSTAKKAAPKGPTPASPTRSPPVAPQES